MKFAKAVFSLTFLWASVALMGCDKGGREWQVHSSLFGRVDIGGGESEAVRGPRGTGKDFLAEELRGEPIEHGTLEEVEGLMHYTLETRGAGAYGIRGIGKESEFGFEKEVRPKMLVQSAPKIKSGARSGSCGHSEPLGEVSHDTGRPKSYEPSIMDSIHGSKGKLF